MHQIDCLAADNSASVLNFHLTESELANKGMNCIVVRHSNCLHLRQAHLSIEQIKKQKQCGNSR